MKSNKEILDEFGIKIIQNCFDGALGNLDSIRTWQNPPPMFLDFVTFLTSIDEGNYNTLREIMKSNNEMILFEFLKIFEEDERFKIVYEESSKQVNLVEISEMLKGELSAEEGWIERFSKEK